MKLGQMKINASLIEEGKWVDGIPGMGDLRLRVRGENNTKYIDVHALLVDKVPREQRFHGLPAAIADRVDAEALAKSTLIDWDNVFEDDGERIPFSVDRAVELLSDPDFKMFLAAVRYATRAVTVEASASASNP